MKKQKPSYPLYVVTYLAPEFSGRSKVTNKRRLEDRRYNIVVPDFEGLMKTVGQMPHNAKKIEVLTINQEPSEPILYLQNNNLL